MSMAAAPGHGCGTPRGERRKHNPPSPAAGARTSTRTDAGRAGSPPHNRREVQATLTLVDQRQPAELCHVARGLRSKVRKVLGGWTHPGWPGRTYNKPVHQAAQINQIAAHDGGDVATHLGIPYGGPACVSRFSSLTQRDAVCRRSPGSAAGPARRNWPGDRRRARCPRVLRADGPSPMARSRPDLVHSRHGRVLPCPRVTRRAAPMRAAGLLCG